MTGPRSHDESATVVVQPRPPLFAETLGYARDNGFGIEIIHLADPVALSQVDDESCRDLRAAVSEVDGRVWLHGVFYDLYVNSPDPDIRRISKRRIHQSMDMAERLGIDKVVFHTNHLPCTTRPSYTTRWHEESAAFWAEACERFDGSVLLENMWDDGPELLAGLLAEIPALDACLDTGHANVFSNRSVDDWVRDLGERLKYIHLSDNSGTADDALPPGDGTIEWTLFTASVRASAPAPAVMVGMDTGGLSMTRTAIERMRSSEVYPFDAPSVRHA